MRDEDVHREGLEEALALSTTGDFVLPPPLSAPPTLPEPKVEAEERQTERYDWTG